MYPEDAARIHQIYGRQVGVYLPDPIFHFATVKLMVYLQACCIEGMDKACRLPHEQNNSLCQRKSPLPK
jgi:hypothetical protein